MTIRAGPPLIPVILTWCVCVGGGGGLLMGTPVGLREGRSSICKNDPTFETI